MGGIGLNLSGTDFFGIGSALNGNENANAQVSIADAQAQVQLEAIKAQAAVEQKRTETLQAVGLGTLAIAAVYMILKFLW